MTKKLGIITCILIMIFTMLSACENGKDQAIAPPIDSVTVRTLDGNGVVTLVMRPYSNPLSIEEIEAIQDNLRVLLGKEVYQADGPRAISTPVYTDESNIIVFGYAVYNDSIDSPFWGTAGNSDSGSMIYQKAFEWIMKELAKHD